MRRWAFETSRETGRKSNISNSKGMAKLPEPNPSGSTGLIAPASSSGRKGPSRPAIRCRPQTTSRRAAKARFAACRTA
jgi:hypothetical protein